MPQCYLSEFVFCIKGKKKGLDCSYRAKILSVFCLASSFSSLLIVLLQKLFLWVWTLQQCIFLYSLGSQTGFVFVNLQFRGPPVLMLMRKQFSYMRLGSISNVIFILKSFLKIIVNFEFGYFIKFLLECLYITLQKEKKSNI